MTWVEALTLLGFMAAIVLVGVLIVAFVFGAIMRWCPPRRKP